MRTSDATSSSMTVQWGSVDCIHHNGDITGYSVCYRVQGSGSTQIESVSGDATTKATISGLTSSTSYVIEVAAVNRAGIGVYSDPLTVETSAAGQSRYLQVVLLLLLSHTCTPSGAFVRFLGVDLPNHSYVDLTAVGDARDGSDSVQCYTDLVTCCSAADSADCGDWYFPSGTRLPFPYIVNISETRLAQQVELLHRGRSDVTSGVYCCAVETNAGHNDSGRETVYAGLYASGGEEATETAILLYSQCQLCATVCR